MSVIGWYHNHAVWNRPRQDQPATRTPAIPPTTSNATVIDMGSISKEKRHHEPLFGPNIGVISSGPVWTNMYEKKVLTDELTQDVVKAWIEKSKDPSEPTTTLQALVNLKRPTLRLSPLTSEAGDNGTQHHGLEFEYDCDAPKCGIYVHVLLPSEHSDVPSTLSYNGFTKLLVFEAVVEGGFGKVLKLDEGATLELDRFEDVNTPTSTSNTDSPVITAQNPEEVSADSVPTNASPAPAVDTSRHARRRFTHFHFRKHSQNHSVSGPALAVVDAEPVAQHESKEGKKDDDGVRVTIRLAALDTQGTELSSQNEQVTYLHVVRFGAKATSPTPTDSTEDNRPWVVKVVKREATIGPHTFQLHEIYGLSSSSSASHAPTAPLPDSHTYPPEDTPPTQVTEDEPSSECLLCLSSPKEVVLLPCRHLVACKECALNMVEFGAGGQINQGEDAATVEEVAPVHNAEDGGEIETNHDTHEEATSTSAASTSAVTTATTTAAPTTRPAPTGTPTPAIPEAPAPSRRKRKAKGWFCPVCRQPYTSLLRITTAPPEAKERDHEEKAEEEGAAGSSQPNERSGRGGLLSNIRPTFLRGFASRNPANDVEAQRPVPVTA